MRYIILFLFALHAHGLVIQGEKMTSKIVKAYKKNILVISRGLEDGINKGDHIKLTNANGFIARAVSLESKMTSSYVLVYRVTRPELISYDDSYWLRGIPQSEMPEDVWKFAKTVDLSRFIDVKKVKDNRALKRQKERISNYDLPTSIKPRDWFNMKEVDRSNYTTANLNKRKPVMKKETNLFLYASPISYQSFNDQRSMNYGFQLKSRNHDSHYDVNLDRMESKVVNPFTEESVTQSNTKIESSFGISNITENISYFANLNYYHFEIGGFYYPRNRVQVGALGFKYHFIKNNNNHDYFDIGYITLFDTWSFDTLSGNTQQADTMRHAFYLDFKKKFSNKATLKSKLSYRPAFSLENFQLDSNDNLTEWRTKLNFNIIGQLDISFDYTVLQDVFLERTYGLSSSNQISTVNLELGLSL
jgi:hypothetical protein